MLSDNTVHVLPVYDCDMTWLLGMMFKFIFHIFLSYYFIYILHLFYSLFAFIFRVIQGMTSVGYVLKRIGFSGVRVTRCVVLYVCFVDRCLSFCTFSFDIENWICIV